MRRSSWITLIGAITLLGVFAWTTLRSTHVECEVCIDYRGLKECATGAGPDRQEALRIAKDTACGIVAPGRAEGLECDRTRPTKEDCR